METRFSFNNAFRFKLLSQENAVKIQTFLGVFLGVVLHWVYGIALLVITEDGAWDFGGWPVVIARLFVALVVTVFVFSGYWETLKDSPQSLRFVNAIAYGLSIDALVAPWSSGE